MRFARLAAAALAVFAIFPEVGAARAPELLPNLVPLAPGTIYGPRTGDMPFSTTSLTPYAIEGCLPEEMVRTGARRCLRYDTIVANRGRGPLELAYGYRVPDTTLAAYQRIYRRDDSYRERFAIETEFHATHTHFHFKDFYVTELWTADRRGHHHGTPIATSTKNGFCPEDSSGGDDGRYSCRSDYERREEGGLAQIVGISAGFSDVYPYSIADQFVEISAVPDGIYLMRITIDPEDRIAESNERDNVVCMLFRLRGEDAITLDRSVHC